MVMKTWNKNTIAGNYPNGFDLRHVKTSKSCKPFILIFTRIKVTLWQN